MRRSYRPSESGPSGPVSGRCIGEVPQRGAERSGGFQGVVPLGQHGESGPSGPVSGRCIGEVPQRGAERSGGFQGVVPLGQHGESGPSGPVSGRCIGEVPQRGAERSGGFQGVVPLGQHGESGPSGPVSGRCYQRVTAAGRGAQRGVPGGVPFQMANSQPKPTPGDRVDHRTVTRSRNEGGTAVTPSFPGSLPMARGHREQGALLPTGPIGNQAGRRGPGWRAMLVRHSS